MTQSNWIKNTIPDISAHQAFGLNRDQFLTAQHCCSGSHFGESPAQSLRYIADRAETLEAEAQENSNESGVYGLNAYCQSGFVEKNDKTFVWYETTRGTVFIHSWSTSEGNEEFRVWLPISRRTGNHHMRLVMVRAGMTSQQWDNWNNSNCLEGKEAEYNEWATFHNANIVDRKNGWKPMQALEQLLLDRKIDSALQYVHGEWAINYGIGEKFEKSKGTLERLGQIQRDGLN